VCLLGFADQSVGLVLCHLSTPDHELHEVARALDGKSGDPRAGADHVAHGGADARPGLATDDLRAFRELGHGVSHVRAAMREAARDNGWSRSGGCGPGSWCHPACDGARSGRSRLLRHWGG
jgi:hypothetical protein